MPAKTEDDVYNNIVVITDPDSENPSRQNSR